jgi:hypothetical protein
MHKSIGQEQSGICREKESSDGIENHLQPRVNADLAFENRANSIPRSYVWMKDHIHVSSAALPEVVSTIFTTRPSDMNIAAQDLHFGRDSDEKFILPVPSSSKGDYSQIETDPKSNNKRFDDILQVRSSEYFER